MKTTLSILLIAGAMATSAFAGPVYSAKGGKTVQPMEPTCQCFEPGLTLGLFGAGILPESGDDDALGGGVLAEYFFTQHIGVQGSYSIFGTGSEHHEFDAALVLRFPITELCIAPYILGGSGYSTNSEQAWNLFVGGGIEARFDSMGCMAVFADGAYHWSEDDDADFTLVRLGVKFPL